MQREIPKVAEKDNGEDLELTLDEFVILFNKKLKQKPKNYVAVKH